MSSENNQPASAVRVARNAYFRIIAKRVSMVVIWTLVSAFFVYVAFAATLLRVVPTGTMGGVLVREPTYEGGMIPENAVVLVRTSGSAPDNMIGRLQQAFTVQSDAALVRVEAGPYGKITWASPGLTTVNGKRVSVLLTKNPGEYLSNQYIAECLQGACDKGSGLLFRADGVLGVPSGKMSQQSLSEVPNAHSSATSSSSTSARASQGDD